MKFAVLILSRSVSMAKSEWRLPSTRRTLPPLDIFPLVKSAWQRWMAEDLNLGIVEGKVSGEPPLLDVVTVRKADQVQSSGAFILQIECDRLIVKLSKEACRREVGWPERPTRSLATLGYWEPMRVILNGRNDYWKADRYYRVQDSFIVLVNQRFSASRVPLQTFDLQAHLF